VADFRPHLSQKWSRTIQREAEGDSYPPPSEDLNAPDLYIPSMAFITYILVVAFFMGAQYQFTPQVLGRTASSGITIVSFEVLLLKLLFYLLSFPSPPLLDLVSYCGYKFVWTTIIIFAGLFGSGAFWIAFGIHVVLMGSFMVKTLRVVIRNPSDSSNTSNRKYLLLFIALMQAIITLFLCYLDFKYQPASVVNGAAGNSLPQQTTQQQQQQTLPEINTAGDTQN
jgi:protein transport protein YIF1